MSVVAGWLLTLALGTRTQQMDMFIDLGAERFLVAEKQGRKIAVEDRTREELDALTGGGVHQGVAAIADTAAALADQLSQVELYSILSPLEHLYLRPEPTVRVAVSPCCALSSRFTCRWVTEPR